MKKSVSMIMIILLTTSFLPFASAGFFDGFSDFFDRAKAMFSSTDQTDVAVTVGNVAPVIIAIPAIAAVGPVSGGTRNIAFTFTAKDDNGVNDFNDATAQARFSKTGETTRGIGNNCVKLSDSGNTRTYSCNVGMEYYDGNGVWTVTVSVSDIGSPALTATDSSTSFTYNILQDITIQSCTPGGGCSPTPASMSFPPVSPGGGPYTSLQDTRVTNLGNYLGQVSVAASDLTPPPGSPNPSDKIPAANFKAAGKATYATVCGAGGTTLTAASAIAIASSNLPRGAGSNTEDIRYCLTTVPIISSQTYSTTGVGGVKWIISIP